MKRELTYDDVTLFSREVSTITSRFSSDVSLEREVKIGDARVTCGLVMSAPMFDVTGEKMMDALSQRGQVAVLHRFLDAAEQMVIVERMVKAHPDRLLSFSVGINDVGSRLSAFSDMLTRNDFRDLNFLVCIDTANGSSELLELPISVIQQVKAWAYEQYHINLEIMAGNVVTRDAVAYLYEHGVRFVRVGISGGSVCSTSEVTGIFRPPVSALEEIAAFKERNDLEDLYLVADGGIKTSGDALKALALGADFVMLGSLLAGYHESNSPLIDYDDELVSDADALDILPKRHFYYKKHYRGMGSCEMSQLNNKINKLNKNILVEGVSRLVEYRGRIEPFLTTFLNSFRSSFSYCNARNLTQFQENVEVVEVSANSDALRRPHFTR